MRKTGFVSLIGPSNSGKSTLVNALVGKKISIVTPKEQTTRQRILGIKTDKESQIAYIDTPGFFGGNYRGEMSSYLQSETSEGAKGVDVVLYCIDSSEIVRGGESATKRVLLPLKEKFSVKINSFDIDFIVLNKIDLVEKSALLPAIDQLDKELAIIKENIKHIFLPVSARTGDGLSNLREEIISRLTPGPELFPEDMITEQTDEFFASEIIREKAFLCLKQELPYGIGVLVRSWEDNSKYCLIQGDLIVEKDSHKGIILGKGGSMIERIGTLARQELERLYGVKIVLKLFVRIEKDWTRSKGGLMKAGYLTDISRSDSVI